MSRARRIVVIAAVLLVGGSAAAVMFDPDRRFRGWATGQPFFQGRAASAWARDLSEPEGPDSGEAFEKLMAGKGDAVPVCAWILRNSSEPEARTLAVDALARMGKDAAPAKADLVAALSDPDPFVRGIAIRAVGELAPDVPGAVGPLTRRFPDVEAIRVISKFGPDAAEAVPALIPMLMYGDPRVRWQAARTLGKIGEPALSALDELARLTNSDPDPQVREHAAEAIGDIGPAAANGIPSLVKALKDPVARVRRDAVRSLGQMGPLATGALADVRAAAQDPDADVKAAAIRAARLIDPTGVDKK